MALNKVRFVTVCQQMLTTGVVLVTGITAAGVLTLDIETPAPGTTARTEQLPADPGTDTAALPQQPRRTPAQVPAQPAPAPSSEPAPAPADVRPVEPTVREVVVKPVAAAQPLPSPSAEPEAPQRAQAPAGRVPAVSPSQRTDLSPRVVAMSDPEKVTGYATVGVTWKGGQSVDEEDLAIQIRTLDNGSWSDWSDAEFHDEHAPDVEAPEGRQLRPGTDAVVIGDVDKVQMRALSSTGQAPADVELAIIDPGIGKQTEQQPAIDTNSMTEQTPAEATAQATAQVPHQSTGQASVESADTTGDVVPSSEGDLALQAMKVAPKPYIYSRAQWGANEKMRDASSLRYGTIKAAFVHHTVNANDYKASDVPALIRGIYAYHTRSRGWSDIGYNFLVDRFGRIWEGRYGGVSRAVVGAHTLGYNEYSFAMSAIGNFDVAQPPAAVVDAYARLFAWKLSLHDIVADRTRVHVKNKYFQAINGHRDAGSTACPGSYLYAKLGAIRKKARTIQVSGTSTTPPPYDPTQTPGEATPQPDVTNPDTLSLTGDAQPDVVVQGTGYLRTFPTKGITGMEPIRGIGGNWKSYTASRNVADITGDGRDDFLNRLPDGRTATFAARADGSIRWVSGSLTSRFRGYSHLVGIGDVNGDGAADVLGRRNSNQNFYLFRSNGKGAFRSAPTLHTRGLARDATRFFTVGNLAGSRAADLVWEDKTGGLWLATTQRSGRLGGVQALPRMANAVFLGVGDLDADGRRDLVFRRGADLYALRGLGSGRFATTEYGPISAPAGINRMRLANVGGSRNPDLVGTNSNGTLIASIHNGVRAFGTSVLTKIGAQASAIIRVGDWNRDGINDLITRHQSGGQLVLRLGTGTGAFKSGIIMGTGWKSVNRLTAVGDVTGDGKPDLVGRIGTGAIRIFPGDGKQGFGKPVWAPRIMRAFGVLGQGYWRTYEMDRSAYFAPGGKFVPLAGASPTVAARKASVDSGSFDQIVAAGDYNGDGKADLIAREKGVGRLWLIPGDGTSVPQGRILLGNGFAGYSLIG